MDFCNDCFSIASCPCPANVCEQVKIAGVVNRTDVSVVEGSPSLTEEDSILYCWRLSIENCSNTTFCDVQATLEPRFKTRTTNPQAGGGSIFSDAVIVASVQPNFDDATAVTNVSANISGVTPVQAGAWDQAAPQLFVEPGTLPPGRWVLEVCAEIRKSALSEEFDCPDPALFPSVFSVTGHTPSNVGCPLNVCTFVGCSPDSIVVAPAGPTVLP